MVENQIVSRCRRQDNEKTLCHAALDASVTDVKRLCNEYRWAEDETHDGENVRAIKQWDSRSLSWADGGKTCVENGVCLCQYHHTTVHEGGYSIEAVAGNERLLAQQFSAQCHADDIGMFSAEEELRNDEVSFHKVRGLSPTRYRFRVLDSEGRDLRHRRVTVNDKTHVHSTRGVGKARFNIFWNVSAL